MGLDDLVGCIELLQERIRTYEATLRENETRTRMALIDPLLKALGWNPADPGVVTPEYKVSGGLADYALLRADGKPASTVEAKRLGTPLIDHRRQMLNYANESGIEYAGLTDGNHWEMYEIFRRGTLEERRILEVSIVGDPAYTSALKLLLIWRLNLASGEPVKANEPIPVGPPKTPPPPPKNWVSLLEYDPAPGTKPPAEIRFWDGSERTLERWNQLLPSVVEKLYAESRIFVGDLPLRRTPTAKTCIVNTEPFHPTGRKFDSTKRIEGKPPLFVNVDFTSKEVLKKAQWLLKRYDQNPADVRLHVE